ncbi:CAP domain-containing protein [Thermoleophilum album]|uniref:CAP domain-containing protein n=1 Tax=Thermoleophilum album TaxID=29539 RepID=UPI0031833C57
MPPGARLQPARLRKCRADPNPAGPRGRRERITRCGGAALLTVSATLLAAALVPAGAAFGSAASKVEVSCARAAAAAANVASFASLPPAQRRSRKRAFVRAALCAINAVRAEHGLRPMRLNPLLTRAAEQHSKDMVRRGYFSHTAPGGRSFLARIAKSGYLRRARNWTVGENISWGVAAAARPSNTVEMWMNSPPHRANLLSPLFQEAGIGIAAGVPGQPAAPGLTYTVDFGRRR